MTRFATASLTALCAIAGAAIFPARESRAEGAAPGSGRSLAVLEFRSGSAALSDVGQRLGAILTSETTLEVVDVDEAMRRFGAELDAELSGCAGEARCIARLGKRIGVSEVLLVGVSEFGDVILTLQRIDVDSGSATSRIAETLAGGAEPDRQDLARYLRRVLPKSDFLAYGVIRVHANVRGASVVVGGVERGKTPLSPVRVKAPATYPIVVSKQGYVDFRASVAVPPGSEVQVRPQLSRRDDAWYKQWWVVAIAGAVTVGAVTTAILVSGDDSEVPVTVQPF